MPAAGTEILAIDSDGKPMLVRRRWAAGGVVYALGFHAALPAFAKVLSGVVADENLHPQLAVETVTGPESRWVERQALGADGRYVWVIQEYGGAGRTLRIKPDRLAIPAGEYTVRNAKRFELVRSPGGRERWTREEILDGILVEIAELDPAVLLIEPSRPVLPRVPRSHRFPAFIFLQMHTKGSLHMEPTEVMAIVGGHGHHRDTARLICTCSDRVRCFGVIGRPVRPRVPRWRHGASQATSTGARG